MLYSFTLKPVIGVPSKEWGEGVPRDQDGELKESPVLFNSQARAADISAGACPLKMPLNSAERIAFFERRFEALSKATQTVAPYFQAFYAALSPDQQRQLDAGPRRWR
jgi:LTXXQ motif family protein